MVKVIHSTPIDIVAYCARVSNAGNQDNKDYAKLLNYMIKHKHWSPFEMANVVMEIETTRDIARQILRHRSFSFQEFSQRYADPTTMQYMTREARLQDTENRQNSIPTDDQFIKSRWDYAQHAVMNAALEAYDAAIEHGIAKEVARAVLPEGMIMSRMYMNGTLRSWIHYCQLRMGPETQLEHRNVATECWRNLCDVYPFLKEIEV